MELSAVWKALARRWYLVIVTLGITVVAVVVMMGRVGPSYTAQGTLLLFPPEGTTRAGERVEGNPYLSLGGLNPARDILIRAMTAKSARTDLEKSHPGVGYEMYADMAVSGPIVVVDVTGDDEEETIAALNSLFETVPGVLADLQSDLGIKRREYITIQKLTIDEKAEKVTKDQLRAGIVSGGGVLVGGLLGIGLLDGLLLSRARARREREQEAGTAESPGRSGPSRPSGPSGPSEAPEAPEAQGSPPPPPHRPDGRNGPKGPNGSNGSNGRPLPVRNGYAQMGTRGEQSSGAQRR
ncbi:hypothetical protein J2S40_000308 [Nocardioides luteus]|uniref:Polysaccharide chain length determinant N-terminal domain-containing protein n=1 Tax=Nocardioides luteus TaxID=1844 RepID=A0ABQ5SUE8_9ACTN|nr:collagen-like protein [Nocardioides luteus]MDR7309250.1 hypothetical protein [Nocardioides luteus]GLJ67655.1 hypothetical protein GCM10017579_16910 [Nocardioides luteus]